MVIQSSIVCMLRFPRKMGVGGRERENGKSNGTKCLLLVNLGKNICMDVLCNFAIKFEIIIKVKVTYK